MPRSARTRIISSSLIWSTRSPFTQIAPASGLQQPEDELQDRRLPGAAGAEDDLRVARSSVKLTSRRITFSSNASDTWSKTTIGPPGAMASSSSAGRGCVLDRHQYMQRDQQLRDEEVDRDHRDRRRRRPRWSSPGRRPACRRVVRRPTWQAMLTMTKPRTNGLMSPIQTSCM